MADTVDDLEAVDSAVLTVFHIEDRPLWKELVRDCLRKHLDRLRIKQPRPVPVVERRTTVLDDDGYLEQVIATPDTTEQKMVAAYILTDHGKSLF